MTNNTESTLKLHDVGQRGNLQWPDYTDWHKVVFNTAAFREHPADSFGRYMIFGLFVLFEDERDAIIYKLKVT